jgi:DNA-binding MarR family transcriptional regulator
MNAIRSREIADRTARLLPLAIDRLARMQVQLGGEIGLSGIQLQVLEYIHRHGASSIATLTRALRRAQSSISELVERLQQKGLVGRRATSDRRKSLVALTSRGRRFMVDCDNVQREALAAGFAPLSSEHRERFLANLQELLQITDRLHRPAPPMTPKLTASPSAPAMH